MMYNFGMSSEGVKLKFDVTPTCYNQKDMRFYKGRLVVLAKAALLFAVSFAFAIVCVLLSQ